MQLLVLLDRQSQLAASCFVDRQRQSARSLGNRPEEFTNIASIPENKEIKEQLAAHLPKNPAKPVPGSNARLVELKNDGYVYWQNQRIEKGEKIPEYEE